MKLLKSPPTTAFLPPPLGSLPLPRGAVNATGEIHGKLTALRYAYSNRKRTFWEFQCSCGNKKVLALNKVRTGNTSSCGCLILESRTTHGRSQHPLYPVWNLMMSRCYNQNDKSYHDYGGRGILVSKPWHDIEQFISDMGLRPDGYQLDRKDNSSTYCKDNCRWVTCKENSRNKRNTVKVSYLGKIISVAQAAELSGIRYQTLLGRVQRGDLNPFSANKRLWKPK